jgi:hypothetical protein
MMTQRLKRLLVSSPVLIMAAIVVVACSSKGSMGTNQDPKTVETKAAEEIAKTVAAIAPVSQGDVVANRWSACKQDVPGTQQYSYDYIVRLNLGNADPASVVNEVKQYWTSHGYRDVFGYQGGVGAKLPDKSSDWSVGVGYDTNHLLGLSVSSGCLSTSSNPTK